MVVVSSYRRFPHLSRLPIATYTEQVTDSAELCNDNNNSMSFFNVCVCVFGVIRGLLALN